MSDLIPIQFRETLASEHAADVAALVRAFADEGYQVTPADAARAYTYWSEETFAAEWNSLSHAPEHLQRVVRRLLPLFAGTRLDTGDAPSQGAPVRP